MILGSAVADASLKDTTLWKICYLWANCEKQHFNVYIFFLTFHYSILCQELAKITKSTKHIYIGDEATFIKDLRPGPPNHRFASL